MKWIKAFCAFMVLAFWGSFTSQALAQIIESKPDDFIKTRSYVGGFGLYTGIDTNNHVNGFNGNLYLQSAASPTEFDLIPSINKTFGFGGLLGHREGPYAMEVSYWRSSHKADFNDGFTAYSGTASYQSLNLDIKRYLFTQSPVQPFFGAGLSFPWLVFKDASSDSTGRIGDFSASGLGLNLLVGLEVYVGNDFSVIFGANHRWSGFGDLTGVQQQHTQLQIDGYSNLVFEGNGLNFLFGGTFGFE